MSVLSARRHLLDLEGNEQRERSIADWSALAGISMLEDLPGSHKSSAVREADPTAAAECIGQNW